MGGGVDRRRGVWTERRRDGEAEGVGSNALEDLDPRIIGREQQLELGKRKGVAAGQLGL